MSQNSVNYKCVLDDLRAKKIKLETAISAIEEMLGESSVGENVSQPERHSKAQSATAATSYFYSRSTIADAAIHVLQTAGTPQDTPTIVTALRQGGIKSKSKSLYRTVFNAMNTKVDKGIVTKTNGKWGLAEWQQQQENPR
jgi:hypothetical protein